MGIGQQVRFFQLQTAGGVQQFFIHVDGHNVGQKQIVAAQGDALEHPAFQIHRAFGHQRAAYLLGGQGSEVHGGELVHIPAAFHPAPVHRPGQPAGG